MNVQATADDERGEGFVATSRPQQTPAAAGAPMPPDDVEPRGFFASIPPVIIFFFACDLLMGVLAIVGYGVTQAMGLPNLWAFRLGQESNLPTWYSSSQLLIVSLLLGILGWRDWWRRGIAAWPIIVAATTFAFLSLDEAASIHEWIGHQVEALIDTDGGLRTGIWFLICLPPFLAVVIALAWGLRRYLRRRPVIMRLYGLSVLIFVASAVGFEALSNVWQAESVFVQIETLVEEVGEMIGVTFALWATLLLLRAEGISLILDDGRHAANA